MKTACNFRWRVTLRVIGSGKPSLGNDAKPPFIFENDTERN
jgi:hypothetical protein